MACFVLVGGGLFDSSDQELARTRILVVDDDDGARGALAQLLRADGYEVTAAADGGAALAEAKRSLPDLVLTDLEMPHMQGVELCQRVHELDRTLPVIVMTAHSDMGSAIASLRAGAEDYLIKPLQYEAVLWHVERAIVRRAERRRHEQEREEYLALVTHDLLNPLSNILLGAALLKQSMESKGLTEELRLADRVEKNVTRMTVMLAELKEATSLEAKGVALQLEPCELRQLVDGVVDGMGGSRARRISVESDDTTPDVVLADASRLERVVANLLTNALKYSADDAPVQVRIGRTGSTVQLEVSDSGIGIPPESIGMLFDRYYRATAGKARASGLGLGLYIARLIVETLGGRIDVSSKVGTGSTFRVTLPSHVRSS